MNQPELQALIYAGVYPIVIPVGVVLIDSPLTCVNDTWLVGASRSGTILRAAPALDHHVVAAGGRARVRIENMTVDGDYPTGQRPSPSPGAHCITSSDDSPPTTGGVEWLIRDCTIMDSSAYGIGCQGDISHKRITIENCDIIGAGSDGIDFKSRSNNGNGHGEVDGVIRGVTVHDFSIAQAADNGIDIRGMHLMKGCRVGPVNAGDERGYRWRNDSGSPGQNGDSDYSCLHSCVGIVGSSYVGQGFNDDGGTGHDYHREDNSTPLTIEVTV